MFCTKCGASNSGEAKFCAQCGESVQAVSTSNLEEPSAGSIKSKTPKDPASEKKKNRRRLIMLLIGVWLGLSAAFPGPFIAMNLLTMVTIGVIVFSESHRGRILKILRMADAPSKTALAGVGIVALAGVAVSVAIIGEEMKQQTVAAERARRQQEQKDQLYNKTLASMDALESKIEADPVAVFAGAQAGERIYRSELGGDSKYESLSVRANDLMNKTKVPYARSLLGEARKLAAERKFVEANGHAKNALSLASDLAGASEFLASIADDFAIDSAQRKYKPVVEKSELQIADANKYLAKKQYIAADEALAEAIKVLDGVPAESAKHVNAGAVRRTAEQARKRIAKPVQKERERIEKEKREAEALQALCGSSPKLSPWNNGLYAGKDYMKRTAHDPDSIEVKNCTQPMLTKQYCWLVTCDVFGKNAFGAKVRNRMRFSVGRNERVLGAEDAQ